MAHPLVHLIARMVVHLEATAVRYAQRRREPGRRTIEAHAQKPRRQSIGGGAARRRHEGTISRKLLLPVESAALSWRTRRAAMTPMADVMMPLVTAVEMSYLPASCRFPDFERR
jgi:hypothetical protein